MMADGATISKTLTEMEDEMSEEVEKRDWVKEAYESFIKNAEGLEPTNPVKAVEAYFERNATADLKERCKAEGKTAHECWRFIEAVARKIGGNCHIDPGTVYAMAMHYFEDVPKEWAKSAGGATATGKTPKAKEKVSPKADAPKADAPKEAVAKRKEKAKKKPKSRQGFFFEMLEAEPVGGKEGRK